MKIIHLYFFSIFFMSITQVAAQIFGGQIKPIAGKVNQLNCSNAAVSGTIYSGVNASGILVSLPYLGGNGGVLPSNTFSSSDVTGLFASNPSGQLNQGSGILYFTIFGTANNSGTATFNISIGGQICQLNVTVLPIANLYPQNSVFCASGATAIVDVTNPTTGKTWMDRNLGASQATTSTTDTAAYGDLYQWGRRSDGHQCRTSSTTSTLSSVNQPANGNFILAANSPTDWRSPQNDNLWQGVFGINNPCPNGYRIPTENELLIEKGTWTNQNSVGAFASHLKITLSGDRFNNNGTIVGTNQYASLWSSTISTTFSKDFYITTSGTGFNINDRADGRSVRCIKETIGSVGALNCSSATQTGNLIAGQAANSVSVSVPYSTGNGGYYPSQISTSLGITGLTATISQGLFATGSGALVYSITGTPSESGTASFTLTIGGQSCLFTVSVQSALAAQYPSGSVFCASGPTTIIDVTNPTTGKIWMDRNLGATQAATNLTDSASYGDLYQWGRGNDGHQCRNSATTTSLSSSNQPGHGNFIITDYNFNLDWTTFISFNRWQGINGVNNPCPSGYRLPSEAELDSERLSWSSNNSAGAFASPIKLSLTGRRMSLDNSFQSVDSKGHYWSSTRNGDYGMNLYITQSGTTNAAMFTSFRTTGSAIRCIKDASAIPATVGALNCGSTSVTGTLTSGTAASGISIAVPYTGGNGGSFLAQSISSTGINGIIATLTAGTLAYGSGSFSFAISGTPSTNGTANFALNIGGQSCSFTVSVQSVLAAQYPSGSVFCASGPTAIVDVTNPTTGKIWMDRNLGATRAAGNDVDIEAYGDLYQWGRGNDGHQCRNSTTTYTISSAVQPGNGNFIVAPVAPHNWQNTQSTTLWQGINGVNNPCPSGYRLPTETELNVERSSWVGNNQSGAYNSVLKFLKAGYREGRFSDGLMVNVGTDGRYWTSTFNNNDAQYLYFSYNPSAGISTNYQSYGHSVRCIKN